MDAEEYYKRGNELFDLGRFEEAIASYDQALQIQPDYDLAWHNRGWALFKLGQFEEALSSFDQALQIQPDNDATWGGRGWALFKLGQFEEALSSFDQVLKIQPDCQDAWYMRGKALGYLRQLEKAIVSFDQALKIQPDDYLAWYNRGIAAANSGGREKFLFPPSYIARQHPELNQRGYEGELASYQQGLKYCPQDTHPEGWGQLHYAIGNAHYNRGHGDSRPRPFWHKALTSYKQALKTLTAEAFPEGHLEVLQNLLKLYDYLGQAENRQAVLAKGTVVLEGLLEKTPLNAVKIQLSRKFSSFAQFYVDELVQKGDLCAALEFAEQRKNICLGWMRNIWSKSTNSPNYTQMQKLLQPVGAVPPCPPNSPCPPDSVPIQLSRGKDGKIYATLPIHRQSFANKAIVYWHISPAAITTFILRYGQPPIILSAENGESGSVFLPSLSELDPPQPPLERGENQENSLKVLVESKAQHPLTSPLFKGGEGGISQGDLG
ncbi:MAG: tetratricopeptide repeat protein, partial [Ornithinimicrobium sp.]